MLLLDGHRERLRIFSLGLQVQRVQIAVQEIHVWIVEPVKQCRAVAICVSVVQVSLALSVTCRRVKNWRTSPCFDSIDHFLKVLLLLGHVQRIRVSMVDRVKQSTSIRFDVCVERDSPVAVATQRRVRSSELITTAPPIDLFKVLPLQMPAVPIPAEPEDRVKQCRAVVSDASVVRATSVICAR